MLITPEYVFKDVTHITPEFLAGKGIRALVLDIDNTLTADRSQELPDEVAGWLAQMKEADIGLTIVSNGAEKRVRPFAEKLGLAYLYRSAKPLPFALMVARRRMGVKRKQMAMVGDQLYADRMAAALYGIPGLMVIPRGPDLGAQVVLKRKWEKRHWQEYYDRGGKTLRASVTGRSGSALPAPATASRRRATSPASTSLPTRQRWGWTLSSTSAATASASGWTRPGRWLQTPQSGASCSVSTHLIISVCPASRKKSG